MKKLVVDSSKCIGCGLCKTLAPEIFDTDKKGKSKVLVSNPPNNKKLHDAIESCPTKAISY